MPTNLSNSSVFNPDVAPTQDPFYMNLSHPISDPKNYGATGKALEGIAEVVGSTIKTAHTLTELNLDDKIHDSIDKVRDEETQHLNNTLYTVSGGKSGAKADASLLSTGGDDKIPSDLKNIDATLATYDSARANGRLSRTDYSARLDALAKDFRADYPGWRDYIDDKFRNITGQNPANEVIRGRIQDINSWVQASKSNQDKVSNMLLAHIGDDPSMPAVIQLHKSGQLPEGTALQILYDVSKGKAIKEAAQNEYETQKYTVEGRQLQAGLIAKTTAEQAVTNSMSTIMAPFSGKSPGEIAAEIDKIGANPQQAIELQKNLNSRITEVEMNVRAQLSKPLRTDPNRSIASDMGSDQLEKIVQGATAPYRAFAERMGGKDFVMASVIQKQTAAMHAVAENNMTKDEGMGPFLLDAKTLQDNFGSNAMPTLIEQGLVSDLPARYKAYQLRAKMRRAAGTPDPDTGTVATLKDSILEAYRNVTNDTKMPEAQKRNAVAKLSEGFIQQIEAIADPSTNPDLKRRYVESTFSPQGLGLIGRMELDGTGPGGATKPGKYSVYSRLQSKEMSDSIKALGETHWDMYKNWGASTIQNEMLKPEILELNKTQLNPNMVLTWDNINSKFGVNFGKDVNVNLKRPPSMPNAETYFEGSTPGIPPQFSEGSPSDFTVNATSKFVNRLNSALDKYNYILKLDGKDPNASILGTLRELGFDPTISRPDGIDSKMIDAIEASSKQRQKKQEELEKKYRKPE